jgi:streptogrisin C
MKKYIRRGLAFGIILVVACVAPISPAGATPEKSAAAPAGGASAALLSAMQRDLGLTRTQAADRIAAQDAALRLVAPLTSRLGRQFAGSWLDEKSGKLMVAVTGGGTAAADARAAGAGVAVVSHSLTELDNVKNDLDTLARTNPAALAGVTAWRTDPRRNAVVVTVLEGRSTGLLARYGNLVRIEQTDVEPQLTANTLRGGDRIDSAGNLCSVGFNVFSGSTLYFLTAGHCGAIANDVYSGNVWIGPIARSNYPGTDYAAVRIDNVGAWNPGPWINAYIPTDPNAVYYVYGARYSPQGTAVCSSGTTTGLQCGFVNATNETVTYQGGFTVRGLTRHSACTLHGDSGGANFSWDTAFRNYAEGLTSGGISRWDAEVGSYRCLSFYGEQNISWYQPVTSALSAYGLSLWTA